MSKIQVNEIVNHFDNGAPDCPKGLTVAGVVTFTSGVVFAGVTTITGVIDYPGGLDVTGVSTFNNNVNLLDNDNLYLGTGQDLQIYHNGTNGIIHNSGDGDLYIKGEDIYIQTNDSEPSAYFLQNGAVELYYDAVKKFETTTTGIAVSNGASTSATIAGPDEIIIDPATVGDNTGSVRIKGDLFVDGTQTIINSSTIELDDFIVGIASTAVSDTLADGAGIQIGPDNTFLYEYNSGTNPSLKSSENLNVAAGKHYQIGETEVLNTTTLGSGVVNSSLTSVGTLTGLTVSGDVSIADKIIHTGDTDTAIRFPAADTIAAETGGSERLRVVPNGSVGIGTNNPVGETPGTNETLHVDGTTAALRVGPYYSVNDRDNILLQANGADSYIRSNNERFHIYNDAGDIVLHGTGDAENVRFNAAGDVDVVGVVTATEFHGAGSNLTSLNASNLSSGTIPDARFPAILPAVDGSNLTGVSAFVTGMIMMYTGSTAPSGWALCDGTNGTPDLRDRFIVSSGTSYSINATGGSADAVVVSHTHTVTDPGHTHTYSRAQDEANGYAEVGTTQERLTLNVSYANNTTVSNTTGISIDSQGSSGTDKNLPPYYALAFIMKL